MSAPWSEERLNSMVDGELSTAETAELLESLAVDAALRERICQIKLAKELVRHAYTGVVSPHVTPRPQPRARRGLLAAGLGLFAVGLSIGWVVRERGIGSEGPQASARPVAPEQAGSGQVILHLSSAGPEQALAVLERAEGLIEATRGSGHAVAIEIVANGPGLDLLRAATSPHASRIEALRTAHTGLTLVACGQTVQKLRDGGADVRLLPGTRIATSALDQVVLRMQQGWTYLRI